MAKPSKRKPQTQLNKAKKERKALIPRILRIKEIESDRLADDKFLLVRSKQYRTITKNAFVVLQSPDRICRNIGKVIIVNHTSVEAKNFSNIHPFTDNEILIHVTITDRLNKNDWIIPELKIQGAIPLLYGYRWIGSRLYKSMAEAKDNAACKRIPEIEDEKDIDQA